MGHERNLAGLWVQASTDKDVYFRQLLMNEYKNGFWSIWITPFNTDLGQTTLDMMETPVLSCQNLPTITLSDVKTVVN